MQTKAVFCNSVSSFEISIRERDSSISSPIQKLLLYIFHDGINRSVLFSWTFAVEVQLSSFFLQKERRRRKMNWCKSTAEKIRPTTNAIMDSSLFNWAFSVHLSSSSFLQVRKGRKTNWCKSSAKKNRESILYLQTRWKLQKWTNLLNVDQWNYQYPSKFALL